MGASNSIKSVRFDDQIIKKINKDANFSALVNKALKEHFGKEVWMPNFDIEQHANISPSQLIQRVKNVEYLRCSEGVSFTFYPGTEDEIKRNKMIWEYANGNFNSMHDGFVYFNIRFPYNLLMFLKSRTWEDVNRGMLGALSLLYWHNKEKREIYERQIEKKTIKSIIKIVRGEEFKEINTIYNSYGKKPNPLLRARYNDIFFKLAINLGVDPLLFPYLGAIFSHIQYPLHLNDHMPFDSGFDIKLTTGYMRDLYDDTDDWQSIVVYGKEKKDNLHRAESSSEPWDNWKNEYTFHHSLAY